MPCDFHLMPYCHCSLVSRYPSIGVILSEGGAGVATPESKDPYTGNDALRFPSHARCH
ncbi:MAG TPA: hypothetical protein VKV05_12350 [Terriglobales bacterium]|nr:hypothetical protein [Terriglobales bacterium]